MAKKKCKKPIPLFKGFSKDETLEEFIQGTSSDIVDETFSSALKRYIDDLSMSNAYLCQMTKISTATISRYLRDSEYVGYLYLCAICIAIRLHPARQRYLFSLVGYTLPSEKKKPQTGDYIVQKYLDSCAFFEEYTLPACNNELLVNMKKPLTKLFG